MKMPKKKSYTVKYKVAVLDWYHTNGNNKRKAAREFGVDPKRIREWVDREDDLRAASCSTKGKSMRKLHPGSEYCVEFDNLVLEYLIEERGWKSLTKCSRKRPENWLQGLMACPRNSAHLMGGCAIGRSASMLVSVMHFKATVIILTSVF